MKIPQGSMDVFKRRREDLIAALREDELVILASQPIYYRQPNIAFPYRQDSFFYYLTGFEESNSCLILRKKSPSSILFVQENNKERELWDGALFGPEKAKDTFLMDACIHVEKFQETILNMLQDITRIYRIRSINQIFDHELDQVFVEEKIKYPDQRTPYLFLDARDLISKKRMIKSEFEIEQMRKACQISTFAHTQVMKACQPGVSESYLHGVFIQSIMSQQVVRESYGGIFASGDQALTLHYVDNNNICKDGELMLVDAGAEWEYYASDITRTFPVNGRFSPEQKTIYNHVLNIQKQLIQMVRPGVTHRSIQTKALELMFDALKQEGFIENKKDIKTFYPHSFGHLLGLDVHDVTYLDKDEKTFTLKPGMTLTVEPGIYIPRDSNAPEKFKGIGIRIEDDILVTEKGSEVLSCHLPKEVDEIESLMAKS